MLKKNLIVAQSTQAHQSLSCWNIVTAAVRIFYVGNILYRLLSWESHDNNQHCPTVICLLMPRRPPARGECLWSGTRDARLQCYFRHFLWPHNHDDQWVCLSTTAFLLVFSSNHGLKMHCYSAMSMGQTDRQTDRQTALLNARLHQAGA